MGRNSKDDFKNSSIKQESFTYNDMIIGDFDDTYANNIFKYMHSLKFARWYCPNISIVPFTVMMDDDYMFQIDNLIALIDKYQPDEKLYMGFRIDSTPYRFVYRKWSVKFSCLNTECSFYEFFVS